MRHGRSRHLSVALARHRFMSGQPVTAARCRRSRCHSLQRQSNHRHQGDSQQSGGENREAVHATTRCDSGKSLGQSGRHYRCVSETVNRQIPRTSRPDRTNRPSSPTEEPLILSRDIQFVRVSRAAAPDDSPGSRSRLRKSSRPLRTRSSASSAEPAGHCPRPAGRE
jgi:hypothetical protein